MARKVLGWGLYGYSFVVQATCRLTQKDKIFGRRYVDWEQTMQAP